jgi:hypothetical protein
MGNRTANLHTALQSLREQTQPVEIVCVDDWTETGANEQEARAAGAVYEQLEPKQGAHVFRYCRGINRAAALATGDLVVITQGDVYYPPDFAQKVISCMESRERTCALRPLIHRVDAAGGPVTGDIPSLEESRNFADHPCIVLWRDRYVPYDEEYDKYLHWGGPAWSTALTRSGLHGCETPDIWCTHIDHDHNSGGKYPFGMMLYRAKTGAAGK